MCLLIILIYRVFFDKILHYSKNIVKSRMNMELYAAAVFLTMGSKTILQVIKMLRRVARLATSFSRHFFFKILFVPKHN